MAVFSSSGIDLAEIGIFSELSKKELESIARLMDEVAVEDQTILTRQGEPGLEFMIITSGTAKVEIDGETVADLTTGDFFGELAVISGTPRTATVTATSPVTLKVLSQREFMTMLDESPSLSRKILVGAVKRLQLNERTRSN